MNKKVCQSNCYVWNIEHVLNWNSMRMNSNFEVLKESFMLRTERNHVNVNMQKQRLNQSDYFTFDIFPRRLIWIRSSNPINYTIFRIKLSDRIALFPSKSPVNETEINWITMCIAYTSIKMENTAWMTQNYYTKVAKQWMAIDHIWNEIISKSNYYHKLAMILHWLNESKWIRC